MIFVTHDTFYRLVKLFCVDCVNNSVNWNDAFSLKAVCEECTETVNLSYSWKLFLVNSTETERFEGQSPKVFQNSTIFKTLEF